jgi:hypothetical protein
MANYQERIFRTLGKIFVAAMILPLLLIFGRSFSRIFGESFIQTLGLVTIFMIIGSLLTMVFHLLFFSKIDWLNKVAWLSLIPLGGPITACVYLLKRDRSLIRKKEVEV